MNIDDLFDDLYDVAYDDDIKIIDLPGSPNDAPTAQKIEYKNSVLKIIEMNPNYDSKYHPFFILGHEIGHHQNPDTESQQVYEFSPLVQNDEESFANKWVINFAAERMFQDRPSEYWNDLEFMNFFNLPLEFEPIVQSTFQELAKSKYM